MILRTELTLIFAGCVAGLHCNAIAGHAPIDDAERAVSAGRRAIKSGELLVESLDYRPEKGSDALVPTRAMYYELSFEGNKLRTIQSAGTPNAHGKAIIFAKEDGLRADGRLYQRDINIDDPDQRIAVYFASIENLTDWKTFGRHVIDPRLFGLQPGQFGILHGRQLEDFVGYPARTTTSATDEVVDSMKLRKVTYTTPFATARMWISPEMGWNIIKSEIDAPSHRRSTLVCQIERFGDVWYPRQAHGNRTSMMRLVSGLHRPG